LHINIGNKHELNAGSLIAWVNRHSRGKRIGIGKIEILRNFSFFEVDSELATQVIKDLEGTSFDGNRVSVETSVPSDSAAGYRRSDSAIYTRSSRRKRN
jgi:ATP-dependent RNA helicase DeaD